MAEEKLKQAIVLNDNLEMSEGKKIAQACHASLNSYKKVSNDIKEKWEKEGAKKIALKADDIKELSKKAESLEIPYAIVRDAGKTEVERGSMTAVGIGPAEQNQVDRITGELSLIK